MSIETIARIRNYRIFRNFTWPAELEKFSRYNLIFAPNGSGKTTLSTIFRHLEKAEPIPKRDGEVFLSVLGKQISCQDFAGVPLPAVRVFNRDSVDRAVFENSEGEFPPIFYLGEKSVEQQKEVARLKAEASNLAVDQVILQKDHAIKASRLETHAIQTGKQIKNLLTAPGSRYNTYNKSDYKGAAASLLELPEKPPTLKKKERDALIVRKGTSIRPAAGQLSHPQFALVALRDSIASLGKRSVVAKVIAALTIDVPLADWVEAGLPLHEGSSICKFCEQKLPAGRIGDLEAHFNQEFSELMGSLENQAETISRYIKEIETSALPERSAFYDDELEEYDTLARQCADARMSFSSVLNQLLRAVKIKKSKAFESVDFASVTLSTAKEEPPSVFTLPQADLVALIGRDAIDSMNTLVNLHNDRVEHHHDEVLNARDRLAQEEVLLSLNTFSSLTDAVDEADELFESNRNQARELARRIASLERKIIEHRRPADQLTQELCAYLGNTDLSFEVRETGYSIRRGIDVASKLSEGERTAIAFLYFLKSLQDKSFDITKGVVVIDDPVSSLDTNALYCAFGYMQTRTAIAAQLFIFTHNFSFFRLVKRWLRDQRLKDTSALYMLKVLHGDVRHSVLTSLDPLLRDFESEYQYIFSCLLEIAKSKTTTIPMSSAYSISNTARRFLETFLAFRIPNGAGIEGKLGEVDFDVAKKARILRFLHVHSHANHIDEAEHDLSVLAESHDVIVDLLALVEHEDPKHFVGLCSKMGCIGFTMKK